MTTMRVRSHAGTTNLPPTSTTRRATPTIWKSSWIPRVEKTPTSRLSKIRDAEKTTSIVSSFRQDGKKLDAVFGVDQNYPEIFRVDYAVGGSGAFSELKDGGALIGKQLSEDRELGVGSKIEIPGPKGRKKYPIEGVLGND